MTFNAILLSLFSVILCSVSYTQHRDLLSKYRWKNRVILIFSYPENELLVNQRHLLESDPDGIKDRDLITLTIPMDNPGAWQTFIDQHGIEGRFNFFLIGKDGGVKKQSQEVVPLESLYSLIDSMPMRKAEMRRGDQN